MDSPTGQIKVKPTPPPLPPRPPLPQDDHKKDVPLGSSLNPLIGSPSRNVSSGDLSVSASNTDLPLTQDSEIVSYTGCEEKNPSRPTSPVPQASQSQAETISESSFCLETNPDEQPEKLLELSHDLKHNETVDEIEELEVDEFLRRSSKYLDQVELQTTESTETNPPSIPKISDFRLKDRPDSSSIDWIGFFDAILLSQLERYCPNTLRSSPIPPAVSISQIRAQATRSYVTIFPEFQRFLSVNQISSIYRWENPKRTALYLSIYYFLWFKDWIPSFIVGYALYVLINRQINPPTVSELKQEVNQRHQLGKQAEVMGSEGLFGTKTGAAGSIAKGLMANSMTVAGAAVGTNPYHTPSANEKTNKINPNPRLPKIHGYRGLYTLGRGLYTDYGLEIQSFLADLADICEKSRNLYLWRRPHACRRTTFMLIGILMYTSIVPQRWIVKNFLGWLGIEFFLIFQFTEKNPKFRKVLNPIWLLLYEVPTDSEYALEILQERAKLNKPLSNYNKKQNKNHHHHHFNPNSLLHKRSKSNQSLTSDLNSTLTSSDQNSIHSSTKSSKRESMHVLDISTYRAVLDTDNLKHWGHKVIRGSNEAVKLIKKVYEGDDTNQSKNQLGSNSINSDTLITCPKLKTFATLCGKVPGNLVVKKEEICFEPMKGFRSVTLNIKKSLEQGRTKSSSSSSPSSPEKQVIKSIDSKEEEEEKSKDVVQLVIPFNQISKISKIKKSVLFGVGFRVSDGIQVHLVNLSVISFDNILNRDVYFNQLVTLLHII